MKRLHALSSSETHWLQYRRKTRKKQILRLKFPDGESQMISIVKAMRTSNHNANVPVGQLKAGNNTSFKDRYQNTLWPARICINLATPVTGLMNNKQM